MQHTLGEYNIVGTSKAASKAPFGCNGTENKGKIACSLAG